MGTVKTLGAFATAEDATRARDDYAAMLHGEFAYANLPVSSKTSVGAGETAEDYERRRKRVAERGLRVINTNWG